MTRSASEVEGCSPNLLLAKTNNSLDVALSSHNSTPKRSTDNMMRSLAFVLAAFAAVSHLNNVVVVAFVPAAQRSGSFQPAKTVLPSRPPMSAVAAARLVLRMAEEGEKSENDVASKISADGTFYDDEVSNLRLILDSGGPNPRCQDSIF